MQATDSKISHAAMRAAAYMRRLNQDDRALRRAARKCGVDPAEVEAALAVVRPIQQQRQQARGVDPLDRPTGRILQMQRQRREAQRADMAQRQVAAAVEALTAAGGTVEHCSGDLSGSVYVRLADGRLVRISDHKVPANAWRDFRGEAWDDELVFSGRGGESSARRVVGNLL